MPPSETQGCNLIRLNRDLQLPLFPDSHATPLGLGSGEFMIGRWQPRG
jgi:hypothetical protein